MYRRATIADVARLAGVSRTSVSRVLNQRGEIADATRLRVLAAIQQLDYHPSEVARSLTSQQTHTIGLIVYDIRNPGIAESVFSSQVELARRGYRVILASMGGQLEAGADCLSLLEDRRVDGVITNALIDPTNASECPPNLPNLDKDGAHCYDPRTGRTSLVKFDEIHGGEQAGRHLLDLGHRRIGIVRGPSWWGAVDDRLHGYERALVDHGLSIDDTVIEAADVWTAPAGYDATMRILDRDANVTAIWALYDVLAVGVIRALADRGKRVPEDVAVVGYNDETFSSYMVPRLTSVRADCSVIGQIAAELMLELLDDEAAPSREVIVPTEIVIRDSSRRCLSNVLDTLGAV